MSCHLVLVLSIGATKLFYLWPFRYLGLILSAPFGAFLGGYNSFSKPGLAQHQPQPAYISTKISPHLSVPVGKCPITWYGQFCLPKSLPSWKYNAHACMNWEID